MFYDVLLFLVVVAFIFTTYGMAGATTQEFVVSLVAALVSLLLCRTVGKVYSMIIRYLRILYSPIFPPIAYKAARATAAPLHV